MDRDQFQKRVWQTYTPLNQFSQEDVINRIIENSRGLAELRVIWKKARKALANRMAEYDRNPRNMDVPQETFTASDDEITAEITSGGIL